MSHPNEAEVPPEAALPLLLTATEVAGLLRKTKKAVYTMVERGQLPGVVRLGARQLRFRRDALLRWLKQGRVPTPEGVRR